MIIPARYHLPDQNILPLSLWFALIQYNQHYIVLLYALLMPTYSHLQPIAVNHHSINILSLIHTAPSLQISGRFNRTYVRYHIYSTTKTKIPYRQHKYP